jgi:TolA-binding protein
MTYDNKTVDFSLILRTFSSTADPSRRHQLLKALRAQKGQEFDDTLQGVLQYLDDHHWDPEALTGKLKQLDQPVVSPKRNNFLLTLAAAAILLIGLAWWYPPAPNALQSYELSETGLPNFLGSDDELKKWRPAMEALARNDFAAAANALAALAADYPRSDTLLYLQGSMAYNQQAYREALAFFSAMPDTSMSVFAADRDYFTALALLKSGDKAAARRQLEAIISNEYHPHRRLATSLLEKHQ